MLLGQRKQIPRHNFSAMRGRVFLVVVVYISPKRQSSCISNHALLVVDSLTDLDDQLTRAAFHHVVER